MSSAVFPTLVGLSWNTTREPVWSTTKKTSVSQREYRTANASFPRYRYKLSYEVLIQSAGMADLSTLVGFFNARQGGFDSFLFQDPDDNAVTSQPFGAGDGVTRQFQLVRTFGNYAEPVFDLNGAPSIYIAGTLTAAYTISATGLVTFTVAPGAGQLLTWTGSYYRRVCFVQDQAEFTQFMKNLWSLKTLELISVKP